MIKTQNNVFYPCKSRLIPHKNIRLTDGGKMKNIFFILGIVLFISSCDLAEYWEYSVTNSTSKNISYTFNGSPDTLAPDESKSYKIDRGKSHTTLKDIDAGSSYGYGMSVLLESKGTDFEFVKNAPFNLSIINTLPAAVTIKADDYIDNDGSTEIEISAGGEATALIYTKKPNFTLVSEPRAVIFDWIFDDDTEPEKKTVHLTIR